MHRSKRYLVFGLIILAVLLLFSATRVWVNIELVEGAATVSHLNVTGQAAATGVMPIALALLAISVTLTLAKRIMRVVLAVITVLLGLWIAVTAMATARGGTEALVAAASSELSQVTGLGSSDQISAVSAVGRSPWPAVAVIAGALVAIIGVAIIIWGRSWKAAGQRYETGTAHENRRKNSAPDRISDWDTLSDGNDPSLAELEVEESGSDSGDSSSPESPASR